MKRINLIPREPLLPLKTTYQKSLTYPILLTIIVFYGLSFVKAKKELDSINRSILDTRSEIQNIKDIIIKKTSYLEKGSVLEREFLAVKEDYEVLKKNMAIKAVLGQLPNITPVNLWVVSISYSGESEKVINISGKALKKEEIFLFLSNCQSLGKNTELIEINKEGNIFNFSIKVDSL